MSRLFWLSDEAWAAIEPHLPKNQPGARRVEDRPVRLTLAERLYRELQRRSPMGLNQWRLIGSLRDELLNGEIFYTLREAQVGIEEWRRHYNTVRPHSALGRRPPAPETIVPMDPGPVMH